MQILQVRYSSALDSRQHAALAAAVGADSEKETALNHNSTVGLPIHTKRRQTPQKGDTYTPHTHNKKETDAPKRRHLYTLKKRHLYTLKRRQTPKKRYLYTLKGDT